MRRYSKNRQAILDCLLSTDTHPTAEWIYLRLKPEHPALSLATVYRNLTALKQDGAVRSVGFFGGQERFDGKPHPHPHIVCVRCGAVMDVCGMDVPQQLVGQAQSTTGFTVTAANLRFDGICPKCKTDT